MYINQFEHLWNKADVLTDRHNELGGDLSQSRPWEEREKGRGQKVSSLYANEQMCSDILIPNMTTVQLAVEGGLWSAR